MPKGNALILIAAVASLLISCYSGILVMFAPDAPQRDFSIRDSLVGLDAFPSNWVAGDIMGSSVCYGDIPGEEVWSRFSRSNDNGLVVERAVELICKVDKRWRAELQYDRLIDLYVFIPSNTIVPTPTYYDWEPPPPSVDFESRFADEWKAQCQRKKETGAWSRCTYFARYQEFLVEFTIWTELNEGHDSKVVEDFNEVIYAIDERIGRLLWNGSFSQGN